MSNVGTTGLEVRIHEGRERPEVSRFASTLSEVVLSLREIDKVHLLRGVRAKWVVADMQKQASDLVMRLESRHVSASRTPSDLMVPVDALVRGARELQQQPAVPALFAPATVTRLGKLAVPRDGIQSVTLAAYNGTAGPGTVLDDNVKRNADDAVKPFEVSWGSITGRLAKIQDYSRRRKGTVIVAVRVPGEYAVNGYVPEPMIELVREAWLHRVMLGGKIRRNSRGQSISIDVERIELMPETDQQRPATSDLLGVATEWLDGLSVDEFMDRIRDA